MAAKKSEDYASTQDYYNDISNQTQAIVKILMCVMDEKDKMGSFPFERDISAALSQVDDNISLMESLVNDVVIELKTEPVKLRAVKAG